MGTKMLSALGSLGEADSEEKAKALADTAVDLAGTLYRFSVPASLLKRRYVEKEPTP
jgi:hypothetical protein